MRHCAKISLTQYSARIQEAIHTQDSNIVELCVKVGCCLNRTIDSSKDIFKDMRHALLKLWFNTMRILSILVETIATDTI